MRRQPQRGWVLAMTCVLLLGSLPNSAAAQDGDLESRLDQIAQETAAVRELPPLAEIDDVLLSPDKLLARMPELIAEESDPVELTAQSRSLAALGLIPAGIDLLDLTIRLMGEQAAGYYDPVTDEMIVVADGDFGSEEYFYAHEVVHALQDAHLDPDDLMEETESDNADALLARIALYEGDAVAASNAYVGEHPALAVALLGEASGDYPELDSAPGAVSVSLVFPYLSGLSFVERLISEGGWDAVNAAYADIPASTEQILHPEKYLKPDAPTNVSLPSAEAALGEEWRVVDEDTLGEFQTAVLLADFGPGEGFNAVTGSIDLPQPARNAAAGWDGDRFALWENGAGDEALVWRTVWDTPQDARAFSRALAQFQEGRWGGIFTGEIPTDIALVTGEVAARILLDGQEVRYVQSAELDLTDAALAALESAPAIAPPPGPG